MTELDPVQVAALKAAKGRHGFGYFMEMGMGKTLLALTEFERATKTGTVTRMVVVCPNTFKSGWAEEVEKHGMDVEAHVFESGSRNSSEFLRREYNRPPLLVINYEAIRSEPIHNSVIDWMGRKPTYIVFDESIQVKTHDAIQTKSAIILSRAARLRRILTGKPIAQGPHDLWGQMRVIGQLDGRNFYSFRAMFCRMGGFKNKQVIGTQNEDILASWIDPHVFRATKHDWGFRVPKVPTIREYEMTHEQKQQYKSMERQFVLWLNEDKYVTIEAAISKYEKLTQIQCGFIIDTEDEGKVHVICPPAKNPRTQLLEQILRDELTGKAIIVYVHRYVFDILNEYLKEYNPAYIKGGMTPDELDEQKDRFNNAASCRIILVQERAGKYGHTLLGGPEPDNRCATTIFFENSYSLDDRSQVEDRNHRRGQTAESVLYVDLCGTSMDRNVIRALQRKENVFQAIFAGVRKAVPE
jgi:SNF2 family DNA or RNA helicase